MRISTVLSATVAAIIIGAAGFVAYAYEPELEALERVDPAQFSPDEVAKGAQLAAVGNCIACHTVPGGRSFAGGLALPTPFGTIHSTNITPDVETGIGAWSEAAFARSMREGVDREGRHLYPAFPYDHYTRVSDADHRAIYAYLMTRTPVAANAPPNELPFPLNVRMAVAGWKALFFEEGAFEPDPARSDVLNRGAYLVEGLGHCSGCHAPRNALGATDPDRPYAGGEAEGWHAYAIDASSSAPIPWNADSLYFYLRQGWHAEHGVSRGPMAEVTGNLSGLPDTDIRAMAEYVASVMGEPDAARLAQADALRQLVSSPPGNRSPSADGQSPSADGSGQANGNGGAAESRGATLYAAACGTCHDSGRPQPFGGLSFHLSTAVNADDPQNIVNVTLFGLPPADGEASAVMPAYAGAMSDADIVEVMQYMRASFTDKAPWTGLEEMVRDTRSGDHHVAVRPSDGVERAPANIGASDPAADPQDAGGNPGGPASETGMED